MTRVFCCFFFFFFSCLDGVVEGGWWQDEEAEWKELFFPNVCICKLIFSFIIYAFIVVSEDINQFDY